MPRFSANLSMLFPEVPFLQRFEQARRHGFDAVECWFPYEHDLDDVKSALADNGLALIVINSPPGDVAKGDWGLAAAKGREAEFKASVQEAVLRHNTLDRSSFTSWAA